MLNDRCEFLFRPSGQIGRCGGVNGELDFAVFRVERLQNALRDGNRLRRRAVRINHVNFTKKSVAERVVMLGRRDVEEKVAEFPNHAIAVGDGRAVLPGTVAVFGPRVHVGNQFPTARRRIGARLRRGVEAVRSAVRRIKFVNLRPARAAMPRVAADLLHGNHVAEINANPPAIRAGVEEKIV